MNEWCRSEFDVFGCYIFKIVKLVCFSSRKESSGLVLLDVGLISLYLKLLFLQYKYSQSQKDTQGVYCYSLKDVLSVFFNTKAP